MPRPIPVAKAIDKLGVEAARARAKIQVGTIIGFMNAIVNGSDQSEPARQTARIAAARLLLAKALPDMSQVDVNSQVEGTITITINKIT